MSPAYVCSKHICTSNGFTPEDLLLIARTESGLQKHNVFATKTKEILILSLISMHIITLKRILWKFKYQLGKWMLFSDNGNKLFQVNQITTLETKNLSKQIESISQSRDNGNRTDISAREQCECRHQKPLEVFKEFQFRKQNWNEYCVLLIIKFFSDGCWNRCSRSYIFWWYHRTSCFYQGF